MACGHDVMLDQPDELARELLALPQRSIAPANFSSARANWPDFSTDEVAVAALFRQSE
jgi:hypothetical protein